MGKTQGDFRGVPRGTEQNGDMDFRKCPFLTFKTIIMTMKRTHEKHAFAVVKLWAY